VHSFNLLLPAYTRFVERLILLLDARNLTFNFFLPVAAEIFLTLSVLSFEFTNFLEFSFFLNL
jgi:hypothetical protein